MKRIKKVLDGIPPSIINFISVVSGILTIVSFTVTVLSAFFSKVELLRYSGVFCAVFAIVFGCLYWNKLIKYRQLAKKRLEVHSQEMALVDEKVAETLFDILHFYKAKQLTLALLDTKVKASLQALLDSLERIMEIDTGQVVNACIKLILPAQTEITLDNARIQTFVRSTKSSLARSAYDVNNSEPVYVKENTDFYQIFAKKAEYFYEGNLLDYAQRLANINERYKNTHLGWEDHYRGTIVVPIRIQHKFLHFTKQDKDYQVIGFLCVDSMSTDAFLPRQKKENIAFLQAHASLVYILLNKYQHYLLKLITLSSESGRKNA